MDTFELKKNEIYTADIVAWSSDGAGVARIGGRAVFVKGAIPGETWRVRIVKATASAVFGRGEELLVPSPHRCDPGCPVYGKCGGCALRHADYAAELECKLQRVNDAYRRIAGLDLTAEEILGAAETEGYRNKAIYAVSPAWEPGFFRPRSHDVVPVARCALQSEASDRAARAVCDFFRERGLPVYDEANGTGLLRHVFTRTARDGALQVTVVTAGGLGAETAALADAVERACPETAGVILNVNRTRGNTVLAGEFYTLRGSGVLRDTLCGLSFDLSPRSFYQVNPVQAERLYAKALEYAAPEGRGTVLDLYCGAGTISLCLARGAERVIGAEIVPEAVENARENARRNGVHNAEFLCADAGEAAAELLRRGVKPDAVVVDPPRKGLSPEVIDCVCAMAPERVVYVSCDVATQARDLKRFTALGYTPQCACAVDMFPRTAHVETIVLLSKGEIPSKKVKVEFSLEGMNTDGFKDGATYDEIRDWVKEKYDFNVTNLNIAQVKQKHGIIERENYNKPKSEDSKQPGTPEEMVKAMDLDSIQDGIIG